jgi:uncharacterized membrane protein YkvI
MTCSIKKPNKTIRIIIGIVILLVGVYFESFWGLIGLIPIGFAIFGYCPICSLANKRI